MGATPDLAIVGAGIVGDRARAVVVTGGTGMSSAFAIGEETVAELFG